MPARESFRSASRKSWKRRPLAVSTRALDAIGRGRRIQMNNWRSFCLGFAVLLISLVAMAQEEGVIKPQLLLSEVINGMPKGDKQEVRVLTASFKPGDKTMFHTHRFPVTVYVLEGAFTLEMEGRQAITGEKCEADGNPLQVEKH